MVEQLITGLVLALAINFNLNLNPVYPYILKKLKMNIKPFNCYICLSFWIGLIIGIINYQWYLPFITPILAHLIHYLLMKIEDDNTTIKLF